MRTPNSRVADTILHERDQRCEGGLRMARTQTVVPQDAVVAAHRRYTMPVWPSTAASAAAQSRRGTRGDAGLALVLEGYLATVRVGRRRE